MTLTLPDAVREAPTTTTHLVGLIGSGIGPSLTPALHEREGAAQGLRYVYRRLDLDVLSLAPTEIGRLLDAARLTGFSGLNLTHPVKQLALHHLDHVAPEAAALGAVNTVVFTPDGAVGHNTDRTGFARSFRRGLPAAALDRVLLLGAGGAGAAAAHALADLGVGELLVADADRTRASALAASLTAPAGGTGAVAARAIAVDEVEATLARVNGLVHATPTGMAAHPGTPVAPGALHPGLWVADIVYRPLATALVVAARAAGARVLDGGGMAVHQAVDAFRLFTGVEPDAGRMLGHFGELVGS